MGLEALGGDWVALGGFASGFRSVCTQGCLDADDYVPSSAFAPKQRGDGHCPVEKVAADSALLA